MQEDYTNTIKNAVNLFNEFLVNEKSKDLDVAVATAIDFVNIYPEIFHDKNFTIDKRAFRINIHFIPRLKESEIDLTFYFDSYYSTSKSIREAIEELSYNDKHRAFLWYCRRSIQHKKHYDSIRYYTMVYDSIR